MDSSEPSTASQDSQSDMKSESSESGGLERFDLNVLNFDLEAQSKEEQHFSESLNTLFEAPPPPLTQPQPPMVASPTRSSPVKKHAKQQQHSTPTHKRQGEVIIDDVERKIALENKKLERNGHKAPGKSTATAAGTQTDTKATPKATLITPLAPPPKKKRRKAVKKKAVRNFNALHETLKNDDASKTIVEYVARRRAAIQRSHAKHRIVVQSVLPLQDTGKPASEPRAPHKAVPPLKGHHQHPLSKSAPVAPTAKKGTSMFPPLVLPPKLGDQSKQFLPGGGPGKFHAKALLGGVGAVGAASAVPVLLPKIAVVRRRDIANRALLLDLG